MRNAHENTSRDITADIGEKLKSFVANYPMNLIEPAEQLHFLNIKHRQKMREHLQTVNKVL